MGKSYQAVDGRSPDRATAYIEDLGCDFGAARHAARAAERPLKVGRSFKAGLALSIGLILSTSTPPPRRVGIKALLHAT
jgi:hypothetical protein